MLHLNVLVLKLQGLHTDETFGDCKPFNLYFLRWACSFAHPFAEPFMCVITISENEKLFNSISSIFSH